MDEESMEALRRWAKSMTDERLTDMADTAAQEIARLMTFGKVVAKLRQAQDTNLVNVTLVATEVDALLWALKTLREK